jgi:putative phosphoesterase
MKTPHTVNRKRKRIFVIIWTMIGIMSDSHDNLGAVKRAAALFHDAGCGIIIHAGDFVAPFSGKELKNAGVPIKAVFGNCDGEKKGLVAAIKPLGEIRKPPLIFNYNGINILVTHSDAPVKDLAAQQKYDVLIFGHTHVPEIKKDGNTLIINPGETGGWLTGKSTVALFDPKTRRGEIIVL